MFGGDTALLLGVALALALATLGIGLWVGGRRSKSKTSQLEQQLHETKTKFQEIERVSGENQKRWQQQEQQIQNQLRQEQGKQAQSQKQFQEQEKRLQEEELRLKNRDEKLEQMETRNLKREERLEKKSQELQRIEKSLREDVERVSQLTTQGEALLTEERKRLEEIAGLTREQAQEQLLQRVSDECERYFSKKVREIKENTEREAEQEARKIIATAIQRYSPDEVELSTVSLVPLPDNDFKGRVIGREGRNIRTFEALTGVDVLVDDTPDTVVLSCFNPVRREVARLAMHRLVEDGRIHPAQITKQVDAARENVSQRIKEEGEKAVFETGLDDVNPELVKMLGRLKFRTSYGQNQLQHSLEVAYIAGALASELGMDPKPAKRAGLLHDIGKAVDHKVEGSHSLISAELAWRYHETEEIIHAIAAHNEEVAPTSVLDILIQAADTLSAARPGARQETFEAYIQRLSALEDLCRTFKGVHEAYAIQAGREVRVIVKPEEVNDDMAAMISYEIARKIEEELDYPGEIKVQVVRSVQFSERAR
ncbi:ribonuclease Y [Candidatus Acetothermia bacterium]|nr:ribonuclease Y [Candidatus Acetothermia bacterium]MBI3643549.1 ribonuclease Y [Candidatus Acetothermia bacterium]